MKKFLFLFWSLSAVVGLLEAAQAQTTTPHAGMLRYPDVSATHIVFMYANDLWVVPREGGTALPLSSPSGPELYPQFSPDGQSIAFSANYDGNRELYVLPTQGGVPMRVTHHPTFERITGWSKTNQLIFAAGGLSGQNRMTQIFTVSPQGGLPQKLPVPYGTNGALSDDGRWLAYTLHSTDGATWKRYRGGKATDIWLFDLQDKKSKKITDWEGNDTLPMWYGDYVYYLSDQGEGHRMNLWRFNTKNNRREQVTQFKEFDIKWPSVGPDAIVFQYGSQLRLLDLKTSQSRVVNVSISGDRPRLRTQRIDVAPFLQTMSLSPTGKRVAAGARGDVWTAPAKEGTPRNLTRTSGIAERSPSWSPDGRWIAYFSDKDGDYELYVTQSDGMGETKQLTRNTKIFKQNIWWAPNSKHLLFSDKTGSFYLHSLDTNQTVLMDKDPWGFAFAPSWSSDSQWIAYTKGMEKSRERAIWLYNVETKEKRAITSGMTNENTPTFDRKGDYLYYVCSLSFSPMYEDLGTTWIYAGTELIVAVPLRKDVKSPYLPKSDEETWKEEKKEDERKTILDGAFSGQPDPFVALQEINPLLAIQASDAPGYLKVELAQVDEVSGEWRATASGSQIPGGSLTLTMRLKLEAGNQVSGTIESPLGSADVTGTFNPTSKSLTVSASVSGVVVTISATITDGKMSGTGEVQGLTFQISAERVGGAPKAATQPPAEGAKPEAKPAEQKSEEKKIAIDLEGIESRGMMLPIRAGQFTQLAVNDKGHLLFTRFPARGSTEPPAIKLFDLNDEKREEKTVAQGASGFSLSADGKKLLVVRGAAASIQDAAAGAQGEPVVTTGMWSEIEPREEWRQVFHDAWRIMRDYFYVENMHGVNWEAVRAQYEKMLPDCNSREDLTFVISEMISELNVGHAYYQAGSAEPEPGIGVGVLGCDFELSNGAYRISKIYEGGAWDVDARNPLRAPGIDIQEGDYLLAVNGVPLDTRKDPWAAFIGMADRVVTLTVSKKPTKDSDARDVLFRTLSSDSNLRYRAWIEHNRKIVEEKTGGRVGYIFVPDTGVNGQNDLVRQFMGQRGKDALIIDERWNGGGQIPNRFVELLNRPATSYWARRDGNDWVWPPDGHNGPKCMLINGLAGSGGDAFPYFFKQAGLGKLIGTRTWGGLVGISGNPGLIDGHGITVPTFGFYEKDGTWGIEGFGVAPDIEVVDDPALMWDGGDPQLDAAINHMLDELRRNPYIPPKRPAAPDRSGSGIKKDDR